MEQQPVMPVHRQMGVCIGLLSAAIIIFFAFISNGAEAVSETRDVGQFHSVDFRGHGELYLIQGETELRMEGDEALLKAYETTVDSGILVIKNDSWMKFWRQKPIAVFIRMPLVTKLSVAGSGSIFGESTIYSDSLTLELTGSGEIELDVKAKQLSSTISGSGEIRLSGAAKTLNHTIAGSGDLKGLDLETEKSVVKISGSGNCEVSVTDELEVLISGSGKVFYRGNPRMINQEVSGSGKVKKID
jgi:hypothetical protein